MSIISGSYFGYYNSVIADVDEALLLGNTRTGFRQSHSFSSREINFDALGTAPADVLFTGWQVYVDFVLQEYDATAVAELQWQTPSGNTTLEHLLGTTSQAGGSLWDRAKSLHLISCNGVAPCRRYFPKAILAPGFSVDIDFAYTERSVPIRLLILPVAQPADVEDFATELLTPARPVGCSRILYWADFACFA